MSGPINKNPFSLSYNVLRNGIATFKNLTTHEAARYLNKVGHCCLNVFSFTALTIALMIYVYDQKSEKTPTFIYILYAIAMWMQLASVRYRNFISLALTVATELFILGSVVFTFVTYFIQNPLYIRDVAFSVLFVFVTIIRLVYMAILLKVITFKNPYFNLSTTVFLKPTNTPVTFSSVMAPQELDPTNPYYPQTVYNNNKVTLLDKSLT